MRCDVLFRLLLFEWLEGGNGRCLQWGCSEGCMQSLPPSLRLNHCHPPPLSLSSFPHITTQPTLQLVVAKVSHVVKSKSGTWMSYNM